MREISTIEKLASDVAKRAAEVEDAKQESYRANSAAGEAQAKRDAAEKALKDATAKLMEALPK